MKSDRSIIRQFLFLLRNINSPEARFKEVEIIFKDGSPVGYRLEIHVEDKPKLKIVKDHEE